MTLPPNAKRPPRLPFVLLGLMTAFTLGGPLAIGSVLRGGSSPDWPPDRAVEWVTFGTISGMVALLMGACLSLALVNHKTMAAKAPHAGPDKPGDEP